MGLCMGVYIQHESIFTHWREKNGELHMAVNLHQTIMINGVYPVYTAADCKKKYIYRS